MDTDRQDGKSRTEEVMDKIIQLIIDNDMKAGSKLPNEFQLSEQLGIGRSTLREATRRLVSRNILEVRQGSGTFISKKRGVPEDPLGLTFLENDSRLALDLFEIRLMLEPDIAALAASHATEEQLKKLEHCCRAVEEKIETDESYYKGDEAFHTCLAECSGNVVLKTLIPIIVSSIHMTTVSTADQFRQQTYRQHRQIVRAVNRRDSMGASLAMSEHLNINREYFARKVMEEENGGGR